MTMGSPVIRPMRPEDVVAAERVSDEGFYELDTRNRRAAGPAPVDRKSTRLNSSHTS